jgi:hypothetical protein
VSEFRRPDFIVFVNYEKTESMQEDEQGSDREIEQGSGESEKGSDKSEKRSDESDESEQESDESEKGSDRESEQGSDMEKEQGSEVKSGHGSKVESGEESEESEDGAVPWMWNISKFEAEVSGRDIASLWEIKPFDDNCFFLSPKLLGELVAHIMQQSFSQIQTQVQFAFNEFPHQDKISAFCIVGFYWKAMDFRRDQMPRLPHSRLSDPDYAPEHVDFQPCRATAIYPLLNQSGTDYHSEFKRNWTLSCNKFPALSLK